MVQSGYRRDAYPGPEPRVISVTRIFNYYKTYGYNTEVMGASFRNLDEIAGLAGCDLLTISPKLLDQLRESNATLTRKLDGSNPTSSEEQIHVDRERFDAMMKDDRMATDKLGEGIKASAKPLKPWSINWPIVLPNSKVACLRARRSGDFHAQRHEW